MPIYWSRRDLNLETASQALLVIAHPDDESMFFSPTITALKQQGTTVCLLCLSNGNYGRIGSVRMQELLAACGILGIQLHHINVVDHPDLQDGPQNVWPPKLIASMIAREAKERKADMIITFDAKGVSGHPNHVAVWRGAVTYLKHELHSEGMPLQVRPPIYTLQSRSLIRKYSGPVDIMLTMVQQLLGRTQICHISKKPYQAVQALEAHKSQYVWFRQLFIRCSCFTYVNMLNKLEA